MAPIGSRWLLAFTALAAALSFSATAAAEEIPNNDSTEVLFLGTSAGPELRLDRSEPSTLLIVDGRGYLIDCGIGTVRRMLGAGIRSEDVKTIFFTHLHSDHDLGLADVMANDFFRLGFPDATHSINIYGPPQTRELVDAAFRYITVSVRPFALENPPSHLVNGRLASPFITHEIDRPGLVFRDDKIRVTAVENSHYALMPARDRGQMKSYSYRIETPHGVVFFTGDTGPSDAVTGLARGADLLIAEASFRDPAGLDQFLSGWAKRTHWTPGQMKTFRGHFEFEHLDSNAVGQLAAKAQVKAVLFYHYDPADKADQLAYVHGVQKYFSGPVFAPDDLDGYCLRAKVLRRCSERPPPPTLAPDLK